MTLQSEAIESLPSTLGFHLGFVKDGDMEILTEIKNRFSYDDFEPFAIEKSVLHRIADAGRLAPSAKNRQAWRFVIITDAVLKSKIAEASYGQDCVQNASALIALCTTNIDYKMPNGQLSYPVDLSISAAFMLLQVEHEGLNSCPVTTFSEPEVGKLLTLPYGMKIVIMIAIGKGKGEKKNRVRNPLDKMISWNTW